MHDCQANVFHQELKNIENDTFIYGECNENVNISEMFSIKLICLAVYTSICLYTFYFFVWVEALLRRPSNNVSVMLGRFPGFEQY